MSNFEIIANGAIGAGIYTKEQVEAIIGSGCTLPLHTFAEWKRQGFSVKKGEKAKMTCRIWKYTDKDVEQTDEQSQEQTDNHYYLTKAFFFTREQVEEIKGA